MSTGSCRHTDTWHFRLRSRRSGTARRYGRRRCGHSRQTPDYTLNRNTRQLIHCMYVCKTTTIIFTSTAYTRCGVTPPNLVPPHHHTTTTTPPQTITTTTAPPPLRDQVLDTQRKAHLPDRTYYFVLTLNGFFGVCG